MAQHRGKEGEEVLGMGCAWSTSHPYLPSRKVSPDRQPKRSHGAKEEHFLLPAVSSGMGAAQKGTASLPKVRSVAKRVRKIRPKSCFSSSTTSFDQL